MSTNVYVETIDMTKPDVPLWSLIRVELRKLINTRASLWLVMSIGIISALITASLLIWGDDENLTFGEITGIMNIPTGILLPVLAILLVTSEWGQRTALATFTLEPRRVRVVIAKFATAVIAALGAVVVAFGFGAIGTLLAAIFRDGVAGTWDMTTAGVANMIILQLAGLLEAYAFAMLIMNSAAAIVLYFALPTAWTTIGEVVPWIGDHLQEWADFNEAQIPLQGGDWPSDGQWERFAVASAIWIVVPLIAGVWRLMRTEVK